MVALIQVNDIEDALGRSAEDQTEEIQWLFYIDCISDAINEYSSYSFEKITETVRLISDWDGEIYLPGKPIHSITSVNNFRTGQPDFYVDWNGVDKLYNLDCGQTVDVTYTHGFDTVPNDIRNLALSAVLGILDEGTTVDLRSLQVGDVREEYRSSFYQTFFGDLGMRILNKYVDNTFTIKTGGSSHNPDYIGRGFLDD